jgi:hypothetical protein
MNLLTKHIHDIKFSDVVEFCDQKILEGVQLDYKLKMPKDLAKHFATFSNTQGGLIIVGVGEDDKGLPTTHEGMKNDGKLVDQVHQFAANVNPLPSYDVWITDEVGGNVFILVRIFEGAAAPYTTINDPTVWVRTGNISTPADREELLRLSNKRSDAENIRSTNLTFAKQYFDACVSEAEEDRKQRVQAEQKDIYKHVLGGDNCAVLTIAIQPYQPSIELTIPDELFNRTLDYCGDEYHRTLFNQGVSDSMPGGISAFSWNHQNGVIRNDQLYTNGLCFTAADVLRNDGTTKQITMLDIGHKLHSQLKLAQSYYKIVGYSGLIEGVIYLDGGVGATVSPIGSHKYPLFMPERGKIRLGSYKWYLHLDSNTLHDNTALSDIFGKTVKDISWSLGVSDLTDNVLQSYLEVNGWLK